MNKTKYIHIGIIILGIVFMLLPAFHTNLWFDESYTVGIVNRSFSDIWTIGGTDVHPVLYYLILKFVNLIFGPNILAYRLFSVIPMIILSILGFTHIKKDFGEKTGILFSFLIMTLPGITRYVTEIRMYSWAMLFVTLTAIYGYRLYKGKFSNKNLILFGIFSLFSAYTHYYGLMTVGLINLGIFIHLIKKFKENKRELIKFVICAVIQIALYMPWMMCFISQLTGISHGFWISMSFPGTAIDVLSLPFAGENINKMVALVISSLLVIYSFYLLYKAHKENEEIKQGIFSLVYYLAVIIAALTISLVVTHILISRYLLVPMGLLVFFMAFALSKQKNKYVLVGICIAIFGISLFNVIEEMKVNYASSNNEMIAFVENNLQKDDVFILYYNSIGGFSVTSKYPENTTYFHDKDNWNVGKPYQAYGPNFECESDLNKIMNSVSGRVWIINIPEDKLESEIKDVYDVEVIDRKEFQIAYDNSYFSFTIIEK